MKELNKSEMGEQESLYEKGLRTKPRFASTQEAIESYTRELNALASKRKVSVQQLLSEAEHSAEFDEDYLTAIHLWKTLSALRKK